MPQQTLTCYMIGEESLLIQCAETWLSHGHAVLGIVSGNSRIGAWAAEQSLPIIDPNDDLTERLSLEPFDYLLSITNLRMLPGSVLNLPSQAGINFHDGPLPKYAGLNTPVWALLAGESSHGVTWHFMEDGPDTGAILEQSTFDISPEETALTLNTKCYEAGIESFARLVEGLTEGTVTPVVQDLTDRGYYAGSKRPQLGGTIVWSTPAEEIARLIRGLDFGGYSNPVTVAKVLTPNGLFRAAAAEESTIGSVEQPGTVVAVDGSGITVATGTSDLRLTGFSTLEGKPLTALEVTERYHLAERDQLPSLPEDQAGRLEEFATRLARFEKFWSKRLTTSHVPDLPFVDRSTSDSSSDHQVRPFELPPGAGATDRDTLVAAVAAYFARLTCQQEFDLAYRDPRLAEAVGDLTPWFERQVPIRVRTEDGQTLNAFTETFRTELERVHERFTFPRDLIGRNPDLVAAAERRGGLPVGMEIRSDDSIPAPEPVGEELTIVLSATGPTAWWIYEAGRLSEDHLDAMERQLAAFLAEALTHPDLPSEMLPLLSPDDLDRVLVQWNTTAQPVPEDRCVHQLIEEQAARTPDHPALVSGSRSMTYAELNHKANQLARLLRDRGVGEETLVGVYLDRRETMMVALLAILKAGGAYVPLDPTYPEQRLAFMVADAGCGALLTDSHHRGTLPAVDVPVVCLDTDWNAAEAYGGDNLDLPIGPEQLCYVIYTSGSTGTPKGVMVEHRNVVNFFVGMDERVGTDPGVWLAVTSLSFDISVLELFWTLARGFTVVLHSGEGAPAAAVSTRPIGFSLSYFAADEGAEDNKYRLLLEGARFADTHGFEAVWTPERHFHAFGGLYPNPSVASSALAMITERLALRAGSVVLPLHHPVRVAEEWSVVDNLSGGRVGIAFAAGWMPNDFLLRPESFADKKNVMLRDLDIVRRLWRGEAVTFPGALGDDIEIRILPKPVQPELPYWITTAGNPETFAAAGAAGANLLTHLLGQTVQELAEKLAAYRQARAAAGHEGPGHVTLMLHTFVSDDLDTLKDTVRGPLRSYLSTATSLVKQYAWSFPAFKKREGQSFDDIDLNTLSAEETDALMEHAFERYFETSGLFGTPDSCTAIIEDLKAIEVDEIACLIDFGIDTDTVLANLGHLARLREIVQPDPVSAGEDADASVGDLIRRHGVTHMQCTPSMATLMIADPDTRSALGGLSHLLIGGEAFPPALAAKLSSLGMGALTNMYGPTETTIWSTTHGLNGTGDGVPIGRPIANTEIYILDPHGQPAPVGVAGELFIGGRGVVRGYLGRQELTEQRFVPDPFSGRPGARMYRTGDVVRYRGDGIVDFLGRVDHQVKVRGYRIELGEIEAALTSHSGVAEAVAIARGEGDDRRLIGYIVPVGEAPPTEDLKSYLQETLPTFMVPGHIVSLERFPLTPNAKVDRKALPDPETVVTRVEKTAAFVAPSSAIEQQLAELWQDVLKVPQVGLEDNFFDLGGHSLLVVQTHRKIKDDLHLELSITDMFRFPTVRSLASFLEGGETPSAGVEEGVSRAAGRRAALLRRRGRRT